MFENFQEDMETKSEKPETQEEEERILRPLLGDLPHSRMVIRETWWEQWNEWKAYMSGGTIASWYEPNGLGGYNRYRGLVRGDGHVFRKDLTHRIFPNSINYFAVEVNGKLKGLSEAGEYRFDQYGKKNHEQYFTKKHKFYNKK